MYIITPEKHMPRHKITEAINLSDKIKEDFHTGATLFASVVIVGLTLFVLAKFLPEILFHILLFVTVMIIGASHVYRFIIKRLPKP